MMDNTNKDLETVYAEYESHLYVCELDTTKWRGLSTFNGNKSLRVHRWFTYKEGFSASLLDWIYENISFDSTQPLSILDPFCGVGTSLLSAQIQPNRIVRRLVGCEINPFVAWVAQTKLNWHLYDIDVLEASLPRLLELASRPAPLDAVFPSLSTFHNAEYFDPASLGTLVRVRDEIRATVRCPDQDFLMLGWSAAIEEISNLRKDGRALRFRKNSEPKYVNAVLGSKWMGMIDDIKSCQRSIPLRETNTINAQVLVGDGRELSDLRTETNNFDLIVSSPPYLNNIDYTEVYKLELWLNQFVQDSDSFRALRHRTLRSHPSVGSAALRDNVQTGITGSAKVLLEALLEEVPSDTDARWRRQLFRGYVQDMTFALQRQYDLLVHGGYSVCVVGNSVHGNRFGSFCIATDLLIAAAAESAGFVVERLVVARHFSRRHCQSPFARESILLLRKSEE